MGGRWQSKQHLIEIVDDAKNGEICDLIHSLFVAVGTEIEITVTAVVTVPLWVDKMRNNVNMKTRAPIWWQGGKTWRGVLKTEAKSSSLGHWLL